MNENNFPELNKYFFNDEENILTIVKEDEYKSELDSQFEIIFDVEKERYYCFIDAINIDEALGIFFRNHPHITYEMIFDHIEV